MPLFRLLKDDGEVACEGDARDEGHALGVLGAKLNTTLTYEGEGMPAYTMQQIETNRAQWRNAEGLAVYIATELD